LEITPVNRSILPSSFMRRSSLTLASVPAASSAVMVSGLRLPSNPPSALISSPAGMGPLGRGSPGSAAGLGWSVHVTGAFGACGGRGGWFTWLRSGNEAGPGKAGPADGDAKRAEKLASIDCGWFVHGLLREAR